MKIKGFIATVCFAVLVMGCKSKSEQIADALYDLSEQYIKDLDKVSSQKELSELKQYFREHCEAEINKMGDSHEWEHDIVLSRTWEEFQTFEKKVEQQKKKVREAEQRAMERVRGKY